MAEAYLKNLNKFASLCLFFVFFLLIENLFNLICRQRLARLRFASSLRLQRATAPSTTDWNYATLFLVLSGESRKGCQTLCMPFQISRFLPYDLSVFLSLREPPQGATAPWF